MIATLNSDCSTLTLNAEALVTASGKTFDSLVLRSRLNCSSTESSVDISSLIGSIANSQISIPATQFYADETKTQYCDSVYYFQLDITYTTGSGTFLVQDSACRLIDCQLKCDVLSYYTKTKDKLAWFYYYAILQGNDCDSCYCTESCSLYTELKLLLNANTSVTNSDSGCGCS